MARGNANEAHKGMQEEMYHLNGIVLNEAIAVHRKYGPLLLEHFYQVILSTRLRRRGLEVKTEVPITVEDEGVRIDVAFRMDLLINECLVVELKVATHHQSAFEQQLLTYLRLSGKHHGMLLNFGMPTMMQGYRRFIV